jgi:hypothetical protein
VMMVLVITFLVLLIPILIVRNSLEEAAAVGMGIGMIVFAVNYPVGFGITMAVFFLIIAVWLALPKAPSRRRPQEPVTAADSRSREGLGGTDEPSKRIHGPL